MKKLFAIIMCMLSVSLFAEEAVLFRSDAVADLEGFDYVSNFEIVSESGYFRKENLQILTPNEHGIRFLARNVPENISTHYSILTAYPSFLNNDGEGAGFIYNASNIKTIKVTATTNRPYDEIILLYSTSPKGIIHEVKMPQDFNSIRSMEEFTLVYENPLYEKDVKKRDITSTPVLGTDADGIYLRGFRIQTNTPTGYAQYSPYSAFYLKEVSVIYDKRFTDEQIKEKDTLKKDFGIDENSAMREKSIIHIKERERIRTEEKSKMADSESSEK